MKRLGLVVLTFTLVLAGCAKHYRDTALYHSSGRAKPLVAFLPVINSSGYEVKWDVSQELTTEFKNHAAESSRIYLLNNEGALSLAQALNVPEVHTVSQAVYECLSPAEFVVVAELIEDQENIAGLKNAKNAKGARPHLNEVSAELCVAMRIRVVDLRGAQPKLVLQEVVSQNLDYGREYIRTDYNKIPWGSAGYANTPRGMVHNKLICESLAHIEGYIGL